MVLVMGRNDQNATVINTSEIVKCDFTEDFGYVTVIRRCIKKFPD
jgi:hypothetical protein